MATVEKWAAAFNAGDVEGIVSTYNPEVSVYGTTAPILAVGEHALRASFAAAARARNQVSIGGDVTATALSPDGVALAGFYEFFGTCPDGQAFKAPARYTFVLVRRDGEWRLAHQHSSPRPRLAQ